MFARAGNDGGDDPYNFDLADGFGGGGKKKSKSKLAGKSSLNKTVGARPSTSSLLSQVSSFVVILFVGLLARRSTDIFCHECFESLTCRILLYPMSVDCSTGGKHTFYSSQDYTWPVIKSHMNTSTCRRFMGSRICPLSGIAHASLQSRNCCGRPERGSPSFGSGRPNLCARQGHELPQQIQAGGLWRRPS